MTNRPAPTGDHRPPGHYEIRVEGRLDAERWAAWFDGLTLTHEDDGSTTLRGEVVDQTALHGLLERIRDLGTPLVSVTQIAPDPNLSEGTPT